MHISDNSMRFILIAVFFSIKKRNKTETHKASHGLQGFTYFEVVERVNAEMAGNLLI